MNAVIQFVNPKLPGDLLPGLRQELCGRMNRMIRVLAPVMLLFQAYNLFNLLVLHQGGLNSLTRRCYFALYMTQIAAVLLLLAFSEWAKQDLASRSRQMMNAAFGYAAVNCFWAVGLTIVDQRFSDNVSVYTLTVLATPFFFYMRPLRSIALFGAAQVSLLGLLAVFQMGSMGTCVNTTVMAVIAMGMCINRYNEKYEDLYRQSVILRQNEEIRANNRRLQDDILTDELSALYNRRFFDERLPLHWQEAVVKGQSVAVCLVDTDDFRLYNETYGHLEGDNCIIRLADVIRSCTRHERDKLIRYGGDKFCVVLFGVSQEEAMRQADTIRVGVEMLRCPNKNATGGQLTVSVGVSCGAADLAGPQQFLEWANQAMLQAKKSGKNSVSLNQAYSLSETKGILSGAINRE